MTFHAGRKALIPFAAVLLLGAAQAARAQFVIGANFTGTTLFSANTTPYIPPDTMGAIGPGHFVETLNGSFAVYDRSGALVQPRKTLDSFWAAAGVQNTVSFDPRILYDKTAGRWIVAAASNPLLPNNNLLLAVSDTSDPTGGWKGFTIASDPVFQQWADYPTLGLNGAGVYLAANMFVPGQNSADTTAVFAVDKSALLAGSLGSPGTFYHIDPNATGFSVQPVVDQTGGGTPERLYSAYNGPAGLLKRSDVTGSGTPFALSTAGGFITSPVFTDPPGAHQQGSANLIDSGDYRFGSNVVLVNGNVWAVNTIKGSLGNSAIRWFRIDPNTNVILETGVIEDATHDYYDGSIAVNSNGDIVIGYTRSGTTEYASSYATTGHFNGSTTTLDSPMLLKAGVASYSISDGSRNRWGDYSATMVDPSDPFHFWTIQEWANLPTTGGTSRWSTQITELYLPQGPGGGNVPVSGAQTTLIGAGFALLGWIRRRKAA